MIGKTIGQYQIIDKIGEGGMGAVYKAEDTTLHRLVALKTLSGHLTEDEEARERFVREAQSASSLNHPNITTVHEFVEEGDTRLICMEYVEGKTIRDMVESGVVSIRKAIDIIMQAAEALDAAHNKGILHRDVKSANIMVNMEGRVKVMDFGLAHLEERSQLTRTGTTMGTLSYSSPEQISGRPVDRRSEIFSLGVVFYELLTGQLPFRASNEAEIVFAIINNEPPKLTKVRDDVPELVEAVVERMLEKDPGLRYQTCGEVISDLMGIRKEMETSTVGITGALERVQARAKRRTIITAATGIVVAGLAALYLLVLAPKPTGPPRLAVLPFEEIGPTEEEWFAEAIANEVRSRLSVLRGLEVVTYLGADQYRTENKTPRQIGNELSVDYLLRASIQWEQLPNEQTQIRLFPELIRAEDGKRLPVETCEGTLTGAGISLLQRTLSELVTRELGVVLLEPEQQYIQQNPTEDIVAFNLYSLGRYHWNRRNLEQAIDYFQKAIERDPDYAQAYAGLAATYTICTDWALYTASETHPLAKAAAWKALELNESLAEAYAALAYTSYVFDWDFDTAEIQFQKAIDLDPDYATAHQWYAEYLCTMNKFEMAFEEIERARALDPTSLMVNSIRGIIYSYAGQYEQSIEYCLKVLELDPNFHPAYVYLSWNYVPLKMFEEAFEALAKAREISNNRTIPLAVSVAAYAFADSIDKAMEFTNMLLERSRQEQISPSILSALYAVMGDKEKAFEWLDIAYKERDFGSLDFLAHAFWFDKIRSDQRFQEILDKIGLPR